MTLKNLERKKGEGAAPLSQGEGGPVTVFAFPGPTPQMAARSDIPLRAPLTAALDSGGVGVPESFPRSPPEPGERA